MTNKTSKLLTGLASVLVIVGLPFAGKWARRHGEPRCDWDGLKIEPLYQVRIVDRADQPHRFCCIGCARRWLARYPDRPLSIYVTDEASGTEIDSRSAYFVESVVVTNSVTGNRVHAFLSQADADKDARACSGCLLSGAERPFQEPVK